MTLLTYSQAATRLDVSVSQIRTFARASEARKTHDPAKIPARLRRHINSGFPCPIYIGGSKRMPRIDADELVRWGATR